MRIVRIVPTREDALLFFQSIDILGVYLAGVPCDDAFAMPLKTVLGKRKKKIVFIASLPHRLYKAGTYLRVQVTVVIGGKSWKGNLVCTRVPNKNKTNNAYVIFMVVVCRRIRII